MFGGCMTALVTPMQVGGQIDFECLSTLVERQVAAGISALVVNGTTAESPTLSKEEKAQVIRAVVEQVKYRIPVIAGTGSYDTQQTIENTKMALQAGVDACLLITPYYNKPTQKGLYAHYKAVAEAVPVPLILYNAPGRTGCDLLPATVEALSHIPNIVALKECVMSLSRMETLIQSCEGRLDLLTGNDEDALFAMLLGFKGVISVTANVLPVKMKAMCDAALAGNQSLARELNAKLSLLHQRLFLESNPIPCKWIMQEMGLIPAGIRLPLTTLSEELHVSLREALMRSGENL